jgi:uncharacterized membrane protein YkvA (DUF1232 family)
MRGLIASLQSRARALKHETRALYLAFRHPRTPWYARAWVALVVAYAMSPIDLIPDFIPVLGYLDDLILVPMGVWLALRLVPPGVMAECRARASSDEIEGRPWARVGVALIVTMWLAGLAWGAVTVYRLIYP